MPSKLFDPKSTEPFKLSRSKIELFVRCPRCFYLDRRHGIGQPGGMPFTLNVAVDHLLKNEFDAFRKAGTAHSLMKEFGIDAIPYDHPQLNTWRENFKGIQYLHEKTRFLVTGAIDDIWVKPNGKLIIVDYKATSTANEITLDDEWKQGYKRQMEIYQWLFRRNGFKVDDTGYFVYANATKDRAEFDKRLEFKTTIIPYKGDDGWVDGALIKARKCLCSSSLPKPDPDCEYCGYRKDAKGVEG
jgi:hypothetical protein